MKTPFHALQPYGTSFRLKANEYCKLVILNNPYEAS